MTSLPYHTLYEKGLKQPLPVREGHVLIVHTMDVRPGTDKSEIVRSIAFDARALEGKTVRIGYYAHKTSKSPRINLADFERMGKQDGESHELRLKLGRNSTELGVEKTSSRPMSITQFSEHFGLRALKTEPYELGARRLESRERITVNGLTENTKHVFEWVDAQDYHADAALAELLRPENGPKQF